MVKVTLWLLIVLVHFVLLPRKISMLWFYWRLCFGFLLSLLSWVLLVTLWILSRVNHQKETGLVMLFIVIWAMIKHIMCVLTLPVRHPKIPKNNPTSPFPRTWRRSVLRGSSSGTPLTISPGSRLPHILSLQVRSDPVRGWSVSGRSSSSARPNRHPTVRTGQW